MKTTPEERARKALATARVNWHVHEDGYHRRLWLVELETQRVIGEVYGSDFTKEWYGFTGQPEPKHLGKYTRRSSGQESHGENYCSSQRGG